MFKRMSGMVALVMLFIAGLNVNGAEEVKIKPQLQEVSLQGIIVQKIKETKTGRKNTYYYIKTNETGMIKLSNQAKGKKGYENAMIIDLKSFVDKKVMIKAKATLTKKGKPTVRVITELTEI